MRKAYRIILTKAEEGGYLVYVPDFDCDTQGEDMADAIHMGRDVIGAMGLALQDIGKDIPEPDTAAYKAQVGDIETYVDIDFTEYKKKHDNRKVKKNLTIPSWLNEKAEAEHINFSRVLEEALIEKLQEESL